MSFMTFQCALFDFPCCGYFYTFYGKGPVKGRRPSVSNVIIHKPCGEVSLVWQFFDIRDIMQFFCADGTIFLIFFYP